MTTDDVSWWPGLHQDGIRRLLRLADGSTLSVQASRSHYCTPRNDSGPWIAVEVCGPEYIDGWAVDGSSLDGRWCYGHVTVEDVDAYIRARGGLVERGPKGGAA